MTTTRRSVLTGADGDALRRLDLPGSAPLAFGPGAVAQLPAALARLGARRVVVVTDHGVRAAGVLEAVLAPLSDAGVACAVFDDVHANPSTADVEAGAAAAAVLLEQGRADVAVLALGGGSALDVAKGVALLAGGARLTDVLSGAAAGVEPAGLPVVAVPTTAGTGAETNGFAVLADPTAPRKIYLGADSVRPRFCLLDPELTVGVPAAVTAATGMDALTHGIESLASRGSSPLSAAYATRAVALVSGYLARAVRDGTDLEARSRLLFGAHLAGLALTLSGLGLVHGVAHATTGRTGAPHGLALAAVLDTLMEVSAPAAGEAYTEVARTMRAGEKPGDAVDAVRVLAEQVGARRSLSEFGVTTAMLPALTADALADAVSRNAPWLPDAAELAEVLVTRL